MCCGGKREFEQEHAGYNLPVDGQDEPDAQR